MSWDVKEIMKQFEDGHTELVAYQVRDGANVIAVDVVELHHARLIAAAPDMLEILRDAVEIVEVAREAREDVIGERDDVIRDLERRIRAALAKSGAQP